MADSFNEKSKTPDAHIGTYNSSSDFSTQTGINYGIRTQDNTNASNIKKITINEQILSKLDPAYCKVFKEVIDSLNSQIETNKISQQEANEIQKSVEDLAKETEGIKPNEEPSEEKKKILKGMFKVLRLAIRALPPSNRPFINLNKFK